MRRLPFAVLFLQLALVPLGAQQTPPTLRGLSNSIESLSQRVNPAVVQVFSTGYALADEEGESSATTAGLVTKQRSSGSGVIVDPAGYIVTNNHVVRNARRVRVQLSSAPSRVKILEATVVGTDREADL